MMLEQEQTQPLWWREVVAPASAFALAHQTLTKKGKEILEIVLLFI